MCKFHSSLHLNRTSLSLFYSKMHLIYSMSSKIYSNLHLFYPMPGKFHSKMHLKEPLTSKFDSKLCKIHSSLHVIYSQSTLSVSSFRQNVSNMFVKDANMFQSVSLLLLGSRNSIKTATTLHPLPQTCSSRIHIYSTEGIIFTPNKRFLILFKISAASCQSPVAG